MGNALLDAPILGEGGGPKNLTLRQRISRDLRERFNLSDDAAYEGQTLENVRGGIRFRGANLWILMFAILICSIGLNVNSTAVIIGAMLISPLMGPILGIGCGAATSDSDLLIMSAKNLGIATLASVAVSTAYFAISPLHDAQSELLARTAPTLFDVLIATFGGFVGIIAVSRREKSNAIPGVAIATALMPPICTVGYSLATGQWMYMAGAAYLYFINLVFIAFSTFILVRFMRFPQHKFVDERSEVRTKRWIYAIALLVSIPSVYTAYSTVQGTVLENRVRRFVESEFSIPGTQVIGRDLAPFTEKGGPKLTVLLLGKPLEEAEIQLRRERLREYALDGFELEIIQDADLSSERLLQATSRGTREDLQSILRQAEAELALQESNVQILQRQLASMQVDSSTLRRLAVESRALYPEIDAVELGRLNTLDTAGAGGRWIVHLKTNAPLSSESLQRYGAWLQARQRLGSVLVTQ